MLGNFSLGGCAQHALARADHRRRGVSTRARRYGREEAIVLAWKFLTENLQVWRLCFSMSMRAAALRMQA
jgi:alanyl-tRNA synthetase